MHAHMSRTLRTLPGLLYAICPVHLVQIVHQTVTDVSTRARLVSDMVPSAPSATPSWPACCQLHARPCTQLYHHVRAAYTEIQLHIPGVRLSGFSSLYFRHLPVQLCVNPCLPPATCTTSGPYFGMGCCSLVYGASQMCEVQWSTQILKQVHVLYVPGAESWGFVQNQCLLLGCSHGVLTLEDRISIMTAPINMYDGIMHMYASQAFR